MSASRKRQSPHSRTRHFYLCYAGYHPVLLLLSWLFCCNKKHSQNGTDKSHDFQLFTSTILAVFFYYRRIARKAEAGRGGSPRSINKSAMCPAMWRLTFSGGGRSVRLSANGCQPHRPNTALIFCAAGYHPGLLRTFHEHDLNF